ncbi:MAG: nuclear transport factor 2 family protein [Rhodanobacteraceae bacterium]
MEDLTQIEEQGWRALSSPGSAAREFYGARLADDAVMLFPGGMRIEGKENILESFASQPWQSFHIEDQAVLMPSEDTGIVIYKVSAQRQGKSSYSALVSSTYALRDGKWLLVLHQQTPL